MTFFLLYFFLLYKLIIITYNTYNTYNIITYRNIQLNYFNLKLGNWEALKPYLYCEVVCLFLPIYYCFIFHLLVLHKYWPQSSIIIVIVFCPHSIRYLYLLSYYDRKYLWLLLSLCGITEKYWALEIQSYSSSSFWRTDFFHKSKWLGGVGIWALA